MFMLDEKDLLAIGQLIEQKLDLNSRIEALELDVSLHTSAIAEHERAICELTGSTELKRPFRSGGRACFLGHTSPPPRIG